MCSTTLKRLSAVRRLTGMAVLAGSLLLIAGFARPAEAQIIDRVKKAAQRTVENEAARRTAMLLRDAIRCALDDPFCPKEAEEAGEEVIYVDDDGEVITDEEGVPIQDQQKAAEAAGEPMKPGEGAWANYDFVPGERVLFYEDYDNDNVGDFPRRLEFVKGNWEVVEWQGRRLLRNTGPRHAAFKINLPEPLPERFTIEFPAYLPHGNQRLVVVTEPVEQGYTYSNVEGNMFQVSGRGQAQGVISRRHGVESTNKSPQVSEKLTPVRIMVDGTYAKMYIGEQRVANVPNAQFERGSTLHFENIYFADQENPMLIGPIRVAAGGADLYSTLESAGEVTTRGITFAVNSDRIRPESTPVLKEIGQMLEGHPDLRLEIQGHTDSDGEEAYNQELSERRAASVKEYLVQEHGVDPSRLETTGFGESQPVADNSTPEGKQQNRRVVLVKLQ